MDNYDNLVRFIRILTDENGLLSWLWNLLFGKRDDDSTPAPAPVYSGWRTVGGKTYPAGSYVVKAAQAYRPHVLDMFELPYDDKGFRLGMAWHPRNHADPAVSWLRDLVVRLVPG